MVAWLTAGPKHL